MALSFHLVGLKPSLGHRYHSTGSLAGVCVWVGTHYLYELPAFLQMRSLFVVVNKASTSIPG